MTREHEAEVLHPRRARRDLPAHADAGVLRASCREPKELVVIDGANHLFDGAGRGGRARPSTDAADRRTRRVEIQVETHMNDAVIVSAVRTAVGKAPTGTLRDDAARRDWPPLVHRARRCARAPGLEPAEIDDVILGCAMPEAEQGLNVARIASLRAGIPVDASAVTVNRFCSSGLQAIAYAAERIMCGFAERGRRRRHRVDEPGADGRPQGRRPNPALVDQLPRRVPEHRPRRREPRARVGHHRARSRTRSRCAATSARSRRSTPAGSRDEIVPLHGRACVDRAERRRPPRARADLRDRRRAAARHLARGARQAAAGVPRAAAPSRPATRRR